MLILDEPTAGVDIELRRQMWDFLKHINEEGTTIILTTHYLEEAENLCRNIAIIDHGEIIQNTSTRQLLKQLDIETFILDIDGEPARLPSNVPFVFRQIDASTFEVDVSKSQSLNDVFHILDSGNIRVTSMRTKSNRLEELFVSLVNRRL